MSYFGGFVVRICRAVSTFSFTSNQGSNHILGYVTTVKFNELTDIVILICCSFPLFTHSERLLISRLQVQILPGVPYYQYIAVNIRSNI